jgi:outer membrane immunogenic protein
MKHSVLAAVWRLSRSDRDPVKTKEYLMNRIILLAAFAGASVASPAFAQEEAPFTGAHVEALAGYDNIEGRDGVAYGGGAGFDFQAGKAIIGIEGEYMASTTDDRGTDVFETGDSLRFSTGRDIYVGGRVGFATNGGTLLYAKGGYTNAKFRARYNDAVGTQLTDGSTSDGYRLGAGIEQKFKLFGPSGFAKLEYRYSNYKNLDIGTTDFDIDTDRHQVVLGMGVRF